MRKLTDKDREARAMYLAAKPKQFGNLHERMKYALELMRSDYDAVPSRLWHALCDLETEVKFHVPANPPFGRRAAVRGVDY